MATSLPACAAPPFLALQAVLVAGTAAITAITVRPELPGGEPAVYSITSVEPPGAVKASLRPGPPASSGSGPREEANGRHPGNAGSINASRAPETQVWLWGRAEQEAAHSAAPERAERAARAARAAAARERRRKTVVRPPAGGRAPPKGGRVPPSRKERRN